MAANNVANNFITKVLANASQQLLRPLLREKFAYLLELNFAFLHLVGIPFKSYFLH